jgi:hypothetical protein
MKAIRIGYRLAAGVVTIGVVCSAAYAVTSPTFKYSEPQTGYYAIDRMAMAPDNEASANNYNNQWSNNLNTGAGSPCFNTAVHLPTGAVIKKVTVWYESSVVGTGPAVYLMRHRFSNNQQEIVANVTISDGAGTRKAADVPGRAALATVNNLAFSYGFGICINSNSAFYAARIEYTYNKAGD